MRPAAPLFRNRFTEPIVAVLVAGICLWCTWPGLLATFNYDDIMNLNFAWEPPLMKVLASNLVPFTTFYRPAGAIYYRLCWFVFGWNPGGFRAVTYMLMLANVGLVYLLSRRLTGSREMGVLAALLYGFHSRLAQMYVSNGTVYDVVCATFSFLTLWWYVRLRQERERWRWWEWAVLYALFTAALNAKEMAAILPALFGLYEWLYDGPESLRPRVLGRWLWRHGWVAALGLALAVLAAWGKTQPGSVIHAHPLYTPEYSLRRLFQNERALLSDLVFLKPSLLNTTETVLLYAGLFGAAAISRKRYLWFLAWWAVLAPLPILFIPYRGFFVMYGPYAAWAMYAGAALVLTREWLWRVVWKRPALADSAWEPERVFLFLAVAVFVLDEHGDARAAMTRGDEQQRIVAQTRSDLLRLREPLPVGARIFLKRSRFSDSGYEPLQELRLIYRDRSLWIDRPAMMQTQPDELKLASYDRVLDFDGMNLIVERRGVNTDRGRTLDYPR